MVHEKSSARSCITLLTDFGMKDSYVAEMKGMLYAQAPECRIVDITHEIPPYAILSAAYMLWRSYRYFPLHSIHVAVVDPGVGTERHILVARTKDYWFIGPDNGVLSWVFNEEPSVRIRRVSAQWYAQNHMSATFHGRDCMAPLAGLLYTKPAAFHDVGPLCKSFKKLDETIVTMRGKCTHGIIIHVDHYGNLITNIRVADDFNKKDCRIYIKRRVVRGIQTAYQSGARGALVALVGSHGFVEIAQREGNAAETLHVQCGTPIEIAIA